MPTLTENRLQFTPTVAGEWFWFDLADVTPENSGAIANSFFGNVQLGTDQRSGIVMTGWHYSGFDNQAQEISQTKLGILAEQDDGTMKLATDEYVSSPVTNGAGSVLMADFNGDGRQDVFLAAHNESPFISASSLALIARADGGFDRLELNDRTMAHDAELAMVNGELTVITATFRDDRPDGGHPFYSWDGEAGFDWYESSNLLDAAFMSLAVNDFNNDGKSEIVFGSFYFGPGYEYHEDNKLRVAVYDFSTGDIGDEPLQVITPYLETSAEYGNIESQWGVGNTHSYRIWTEDFNHDGLVDIISGQSLWSASSNDWPSTLQLLQNEGNFEFADVTDRFNSGLDRNMDEIDYLMQKVDLDGSGINSYLAGNRNYSSTDRQSNFLLVNDGTGQLHVVLHDEFVTIGEQVLGYAGNLYDDYETGYINPDANTPKFHGYVNSQGKLNYVAEVQAGRIKGDHSADISSVLVNVPLEIDITQDVIKNITITDRNGSKLIRTFAGDDLIAQKNAAASANIDGGLGFDVASYDSERDNFSVVKVGAAFKVSSDTLDDTLINFERLQFRDFNIALDMDGNAGDVAILLGSIFGREAVQNKGYAGMGLDLMDKGMGFDELALAALDAAGLHSNDEIVSAFWFNLTGTMATMEDKAPYVAMLEEGMATSDFVRMVAESEYNTANIDLVGLHQTGLEYLPVL